MTVVEFLKSERTQTLSGKTVADIAYTKPRKGFMTGFCDLDYFIGGMRPGWYMVFTGETGHGKTTITRQIVMSAAMQGRKPFYFAGEETLETEARNLAKTWGNIEIETIREHAGRVQYIPTKDSYRRFQQWGKDKIVLVSFDGLEEARRDFRGSFDKLLVDVEMVAAYNSGSRFFVLDNMKKITLGKTGSGIFDLQRAIVRKIQRFAHDRDVPVLLVTHPNKVGDPVGGVSEITDFADCVIRIKRLLTDADRTKWLKETDMNIAPHTTGILIVTKAREGGILGTAPLSWDEEKGRLINLTGRIGALDYEEAGWWTKAVSPF